jgi:membrane fusion protein, multidrug efflux system
MAEDVAELETRPAELKRSEKPDPAPTRENDDQSQPKDAESKDRKV